MLTPEMKDLEEETTPLLVSDPPKFLVNRFDGPAPSDVSKVWIDNEAKPKKLKFATLICQPGRELNYRLYSTRPRTIKVDYFETGLQRRRNEEGHLSPDPSPFAKVIPFWAAKFIPTYPTVQDYAVLFQIDPAAPVQIRHSPGRWEPRVSEVGYVLMPLKPGFGAWLAHIGLGFWIQTRDKDISFTITAQLYYKKSDTNYVRVVEHKSNQHCWELECNPRKPNLKKGKVS